jgi:DinB superfamily
LQIKSIFTCNLKVLCDDACMNAVPEPQLAPPGAGLPKAELFIARKLFAFTLMRGNRDSFNAHFQRERSAIGALVRSCDAESAARRVLIDRLPGMEDSSRNWSVWMTLDHLRIIHRGLSRTIGSLAKGMVPPGQASTAAVKPSPDVTGAVVAEYEKSCDDLMATVAAIPDLKTTARFAHPWFGPLDAAGWHAMAGTHLTIHRKQIERIIAGL